MKGEPAMVNHRALSLLYRLLTIPLLNGIARVALRDAAFRFRELLPREMFEGMDRFFFRDAIGNIDFDGDGKDDSFRLTVTNAWFDQRITGIEMYIDGRLLPPEAIIFRSHTGEMRASSPGKLKFPPGEAMEIIAERKALADGLHFIDITLHMELVSMLMPGLPVVMRAGKGDFLILPDCMSPLPPWPPGPLPPGRAHLVPHVHYDVEWLHTRETFEKVGAANLREALRLLESDPEMTFVIDQVPQLEPFRKADPDGFGKFVALAAEGRVEPVNGMYSEPDTNLVSGESLVRQSVAWQKYAGEWFGRISRSGWLIDSFGMSAQLPQIMALSGVEFFAFSRSRVPEGVPSEFHWEGIDGTRILAHNMPLMYNVGHPMPTSKPRALCKMLKDYTALRARSSTEEVFYPAGVDHGRPQAEYGEMSRAFNGEVEDVTFTFSLPSRFADSLSGESLPVIRGEFQRELWGTYSARAELKQLNRACEFALLDAGKLATIAHLAGADYPSYKLEKGWLDLMDNQFHDQICGCSTDEVASGMVGRFRRALDVSGEVMLRSARHLAGRGVEDTCAGAGGMTLLAFNPLAQPVSSVIEFELMLPPGWEGVSVLDGGVRLTVQVVDSTAYGNGDIKRARLLIRPDLPPLGYGVFEIVPAPGGSNVCDCPVKAAGTTLSNEFLTVTVDGCSGLLKGAVLADGTEFDLDGANYLTLERDFGNLYEARALGTTFLRRRRVSRVDVVENGPLRAAIEVAGVVGRSPFIQRLSLESGSPRIDIDTAVNFRDRHCRLRCRIPTGLDGGVFTHEIPYGALERPGHELPAQNFTDLSVPGRGITLVNFGIPGNKCDRGTIYLTLLRSTDKIFLWDAGPMALELGDNNFKYSIYPHRGDWVEAESTFEAYRRNNNPRAFVVSGPGGTRAKKRFSSVECESRDVMVSALEIADGGEVMLRLWETTGGSRTVSIKIGFNVVEATRTDLLGRPLEAIPVKGDGLELDMRPFQIDTILLGRA